MLAHRLTPRLKSWLLWDGQFCMGPRYVRLLEGIERTGSIREGCRGTGMSYRTCLNRIRQMERIFGAAVVATSRGGAARGGAELTLLGRQLIRAYRRWRGTLERLSDRAFEDAFNEVLRATDGRRMRRRTVRSGIR